MLPGHTSAEVCDPKVDRPEGRRPRTHVASLASTPSGTFAGGRLAVGAFGASCPI